MKNVVFLIHGIGAHPEGWSEAEDGPIAAITKAAEYYPGFNANEPLTGAIEFVEIRYDDIFDNIRHQWAKLADGLSAGALPNATPNILHSITGVISHGGGDSFVATHVLDVGLYVSFRIVQRLVQLRVASKMMNTIADHAQEPEGSRNYFVVAHSLGTTIAHDAIQRMATTGWLTEADKVSGLIENSGFSIESFHRAVDRYGKNPFAPGNFKFDGIFQLCNTSRLLSQTKPAYESSVRPMFSSGPKNNAVRKFYNAEHVLDPIGKFKKHRAKEAWPVAASNFTATDLFDIDHLHSGNVHGFAHYMTHPAVHARLLFLAAPTRFTTADFQTALARIPDGGDFPRFSSRFLDENLRDSIEAQLSALSPNTLDQLPDFIEPQVRAFLGGIQVPNNVMDWLKTALGLKTVLDGVQEQFA